MVKYWVIRARVMGGVTGTRLSYVKDKDGSVRHFEDKKEADDLASDLTAKMNSGNTNGATFRYWTVDA